MSLCRNPIALAIASITFFTGTIWQTAGAQTSTDGNETLGEIIVKGSRFEAAPRAAGVLDDRALAPMRASSSDTAALLRDIPGISLQGSGGVSTLPVIHGLADDRLRIKVDGMDLISACGNHMNPPLSYIDPAQVSDIKVLAGITPVSLGGDSIGGTIVVNSAEPEFAGDKEGTLLKGEAGAFYRSNGHNTGGNLAATLANETFSINYQGATVSADNYKAGDDFKPAGPAASGRRRLDADEVGSSYYTSTNQSVKLALRHDNHLGELKIGVQDIPDQGWTNQRMDMTANDSTQVNLRYQGMFDWGTLKASVYREKTRHKMQFGDDKLFWYGPNATAPATDGIPGPICLGPACFAAGMPMDTRAKNTGITVSADISLSNRDLLRVGGESQQYHLDDWWAPSGKGMFPNVFWSINDGERNRLALYAEWEAAWNSRWLSLFGARQEIVSMETGPVQGYNASYAAEANAFNAADRNEKDHNLDLTALFRYTPGKTASYEFGYARKTRSPNLYERFAWSTGGMAMRMINWAGDGNGYVGNLNLDQEIAHTLSASADWHDASGQQWGIKATPYLSYVEDYIDAARCVSAGASCGAANQTATTGFVNLQFVNQSARLYGVDVSGYTKLGRVAGLGEFSLTGVLNYVRGENRTTGDDLYNIMPVNARLALVQNLGAWTGTVEYQLVDGKEKVSAVRNELQTDGYSLLNLRCSYQWQQLRLDAGVENVFDRFYNHPLGGAYLGQGKTMTANGVAWGTAVPGMGRSIYTGINVSF